VAISEKLQVMDGRGIIESREYITQFSAEDGEQGETKATSRVA
jgi:hypothetical protein